MTKNLTAFLEKEKQLVDKATPGPWETEFDKGIWINNYNIGICKVLDSDDYIKNSFPLGDAAFIANARSSIPKLLEIIEVMSEALEKAQCECGPAGFSNVGPLFYTCEKHEALTRIEEILRE